jgi:hypothetical protein
LWTSKLQVGVLDNVKDMFSNRRLVSFLHHGADFWRAVQAHEAFANLLAGAELLPLVRVGLRLYAMAAAHHKITPISHKSHIAACIVNYGTNMKTSNSRYALHFVNGLLDEADDGVVFIKVFERFPVGC